VNKQLAELKSSKRATFFAGVAVALVLIATLWPLNPFPINRVSRLPGTSGLKLEGGALVVSDGVLEPPQNDSSQSYTLEILVRPASIKGSGTILTFYVPGRTRQLQVRQWRDGLLVTHDARVESDKTRTIKFDVDHIFHDGKLVFIAVSSGQNGTAVYVDGQPSQSFPRFGISGTDLFGEIVLGISPVRYEAWKGEMKGLAIYAKQLTAHEVSQHYRSWTEHNDHSPADLGAAIARYAFTETPGNEIHSEVASAPSLIIPASFSVPHKRFLESPKQEFRASWKYAWEAATNIAGFIPLGLIVCACLAWTRTRWKAISTAIFFCGLLSFAIEVAQYYIPRRGSGITDIITNTLGAALGAALVQSDLVHKVMYRIGLMPPDQSAKQR
jgi:VanZ family protein